MMSLPQGLIHRQEQLIWNVIEASENRKMTSISYHIIWKAANARYVVILDKVAAEGTPFELKNDYVQDIMSVYECFRDEIKTLDKRYKKIRDGYQIK